LISTPFPAVDLIPSLVLLSAVMAVNLAVRASRT
jgi:hypothetical protein